MKHTLRHGPGYLQIDHSESPGLTPADVAHVPGAIAVAGGVNFESDVYQCSHCQRTIMVHAPEGGLEKKRGYCPKCHHYICNECDKRRARTLECKPMAQVFDELAEQITKFAGREEPLILLTDKE